MSDDEVQILKRKNDSGDERTSKKSRTKDRLTDDAHRSKKEYKKKRDRDRDRDRDKYEEDRGRNRYESERRRDRYEDRNRRDGKTRYRDLDKPEDEPRYRSYYGTNRSPSYEEPEVKHPRYYGSDAEKERREDERSKDVKYMRYYGSDSEEFDRNKKRDKNRDRSDTVNTAESGKDAMSRREKKTVDLLTSKTGGAYIPPAKLRMMQAQITDKSSAAYQRIAWEALKKSIHGFINKVNVSNIALITKELLRENIVRGRGLLCKSIIQAQAASPTFTHVYAALVALINVKFPSIGELLLKRLVLQFKRSFKRNDKPNCIAAAAFVAHLVNQRVAHEILALEILTLLVESPTDDSVEVSIAFLKECGQKLSEVSPKGINAIFEMLRNILHEGQLDKRIQYMIEVVFQVRKDGFKDHAAIIEELDLVEEEDQFTHLITLEDVKDGKEILSTYFKMIKIFQI